MLGAEVSAVGLCLGGALQVDSSLLTPGWLFVRLCCFQTARSFIAFIPAIPDVPFELGAIIGSQLHRQAFRSCISAWDQMLYLAPSTSDTCLWLLQASQTSHNVICHRECISDSHQLQAGQG